MAFALTAFVAAAIASPGIVAVGPDAAHQALAAVMPGDDTYAGCSAAEREKAAASADVRTLGMLNGHKIIQAGVQASCACGNVNCPFHVVELSSPPRILLTTMGYKMDLYASAPGEMSSLIVRSHNSALVSDETRYAWTRGKYVAVGSWRMRADTGARKPDSIAVKFAPGTSSATLRGSVGLGWDDAYAFDAAKGQKLTVGAISSKRPLTFTLFAGPQFASVGEVKAGKSFILPAGGSYQLHVENDSETPQPYSLTLSIR